MQIVALIGCKKVSFGFASNFSPFENYYVAAPSIFPETIAPNSWDSNLREKQMRS